MTGPAALTLEHVGLRNFRSICRASLELEGPLVVVCGPNGVGKTNLAEAIALACQGFSPRTSAELRCIRDGEAACRVEAVVARGGQVQRRSVVIDGAHGKQLVRDTTTDRSIDAFAADAPVVCFLPERLLVMRGAPARRRQLLDRLVQRLVPGAGRTQRAYAAALTQRNALLRRARPDGPAADQLAAWDAQVAEHGAALRAQRRAVLDELNPRFAARLCSLTGLEDGAVAVELRGDQDIRLALAACRAVDVRRGTTGAGPHLDDVSTLQGARNLRSHGSTGEQRAALLAWSLAEADLVAERTGVRPLLVLDEPYAELDAARRRLLSDALAGAGMAIVTTTELPAHLAARPGVQVVDAHRDDDGCTGLATRTPGAPAGR